MRQILPVNPAASARASKVVRRVGKTPVLVDDEARLLIRCDRHVDALVSAQSRAGSHHAYTFARISAALALKFGHYEIRGRRGYLALTEKGGKEIDAPCHHELDEALDAWLPASGLAGQRGHYLFPIIPTARRS